MTFTIEGDDLEQCIEKARDISKSLESSTKWKIIMIPITKHYADTKSGQKRQKENFGLITNGG